MSAPDGGYGQIPPQQYGQPTEFAEHQQQNYGATASPPAQPVASASADTRKKKRAYAPGQFDVGVGGNAVTGGQPPGPNQFGAPQPAYGGYRAPELQASPYGQPYGMPQPAAAPVYGQQQPVYQAPDAYYPGPEAPMQGQPGQPGVGGITAAMGSMNLGAGAQMHPQPGPVRSGPLNQLYPADLLTQPFNVAELDLPPPPIILPANVSGTNPSRNVTSELPMLIPV
jgi:protein transport protein SEC24